MAKKRLKTCNGNSNVAVDRISELPDPLICHILSFVPTVYAVRMSVISRRWRRIWYSVPTLQFSYNDGFHEKKSFDIFVEKCLMHRSRALCHIADSVVTGFKLEFLYSTFNSMPPVNMWLKSPIIRTSIKELDICAINTTYNYPCMPLVALNGSSLGVVKLKGLELDGSCSVNLPCLKSLHLDSVIFRNGVNHVLRDLMIGCPSLEKFVLNYRPFYAANIKISSSSLKFLEMGVLCCNVVKVAALNLQSLVVNDCARIDFSSCRAIRNLLLSGLFSTTDQNFEDQICKLTQLENLTLMRCAKFKRINISSSTLKFFSLQKWNKQELKVTTETPNLVSFKYDGDIGFTLAMGSPNPQLSGNFFIRRDPSMKKHNTEWYGELVNFLSDINCSWNKLILYACRDEALIIPNIVRKTCHPPWPNLRHLKVWISEDMTRESDLRKALQWLSPSLETLSIEKDNASFRHDFFYKWLLQHN